MKIKSFLKNNVEGYLFKDLKTMKNVKLRKNQKTGYLGYPIVMSVVSGIELLGGLMQKNTFEMRRHSAEYFKNYFENYFEISCPKYSGLSDIFLSLIRNGLAHTFLTKTGILITKGNPSGHLKVMKINNDYYLNIDAIEFLNDFKISYEKQVVPIVWGSSTSTTSINKQDMECRLNEMISEYQVESNNKLSPLSSRATVLLNYLNLISSLTNGTAVSGVSTSWSGFTHKIN
jgi:hypothetical protein